MSEKIEIKDAKREAIIAHNLEMMNGPMMELITFDSVGGNAGDAESNTGNNYPCVTANGFVDKEGKIIIVENIQNVPAEIAEKEKRFSMDVALNKGASVKRIVGLEDWHDMGPTVKSILQESIDKFNALQQQGNPYLTLAEEIVRINFEQRYPNREKPRVLARIVELLKQGDIESARQTFNWERDKLLNYPGLVPFLEDKLK